MTDHPEVREKVSKLQNKKNEWTRVSFSDKVDLLKRSLKILDEVKEEV